MPGVNGRKKSYKMDTVVRPRRKKATGHGIHRINNLPDDIILHILSFLPIRDAIRTSILSRRWKYLWTSMSDIKFEDNRYSSVDFLEFVDRVLRQHDSSDIIRLTLMVRYERVPSFRIHSWISTALTHNVQHLNLSMTGSIIHSLPCSLFTCQSLRFLCLDFCEALQTPTCVHLSHLKTLWLWHVEFVDDKSAESLFSGCPVLEELQLWDCEWKNIKNIKIMIPTLKKLEIGHLVYCENRENRLRGVINIYVPNLISLDYYTLWGVDFYLHNLCSVVDVSIQGFGLLNLDDHENGRRLLNVVASAYNVKSLAIKETSLETRDEVEDFVDRLPTFHNLTKFTMTPGLFAERTTSCRALMDLLEKMPNLKCINFDGGFKSPDKEFEDEQHMLERVPRCVENSLEKVVMSRFTERCKDVYILRYFLRNANKLEMVTLYVDEPSSYEKKICKWEVPRRVALELKKRN